MRLRCYLLALAISFCAFAKPCSAAERRILLYDPDNSYGDILDVSAAFKHFLDGTAGGWTFQTVTDRSDFETLAAQPESHFAIVSSGYLHAGPKIKLTPLLVPAAHGDPYYHKLLLGRENTTQETLSGHSIAATAVFESNSAQSRAIVAELSKQGIANPVLVGVPKDVDALMALHLKQVDAALVTLGSIDVLRRVNPQAVAAFHVIFETKKISRAPLCTIGTNAPSDEQALLRQEFAKMGKTAPGRVLMQRMEFDAWIAPPAEVMR